MESQPEIANRVESRPGLGEEKRVVRATGVIAFGTLVSRITGLVRDIVLGSLFGTQIAADAYYVAFRIPSLLRELFAEGSMSAAFIPVFTEYLTRKTKEETRELVRSAFTTLLILLLIVVGAGILLSRWIVSVMARGFADEPGKFNLTVSLTQIMFPYLLLISLAALVMGILNSHRRFGPPALSSAVFNVGSIATVLIAAPLYSEPILAAALGVTLGGLLQFAFQLPALAKTGMIPPLRKLFAPVWPIHPGVKKMGALILPTMIGLSVAQVNILVNTLLATYLPEGSVSYLYFGMRLIHFPLGMFGVALATALLPTLSTQAARREFGEMRKTVSFGLRLIFYICIPAMVGLITLRVPIVSVLFQHGEFGRIATEGTATAVLYYAVGLWAFAGVRVVVPAFYSMQDTRTPVKIGVLAMLANIVLNLILMLPLRHGGLALAASLASGLNLTLLLWVLRKRIGRIDGRRILSSAAKVLLASTAIALPSLWLSHLPVWETSGELLQKIGLLAGAIGVGLFGFVLFHSVLKTEEQRFLFELVKEKIFQKSSNAGG
jgi:putative peptidoglycan lipid II flippase